MSKTTPLRADKDMREATPLRAKKEKRWAQQDLHDKKSGDIRFNIFGKNANSVATRRMRESGWAL